MEVLLYVYDLSKGLAREMSASFLGVHLDGIYHTSIVLKPENVEYVYDGGILRIRPGTSHLGQPKEVIPLGHTELPKDVILEYLDSIRSIYTAEAYDLWRHNCNSFSNDFANFLLGKGIPEHIIKMPDIVLDTPLGRMLKPMLDEMIQNRQGRKALLGIQENATNVPQNSRAQVSSHSPVKVAKSLPELDSLLESAQKSSAVVFFTSHTCGPCQMVYPLYDQLAAENTHKCTFIKVDTAKHPDVGMKYSIRANPTFITFLHGEEENRWLGADQNTLRGNINILAAMAWPQHPHESLNLPTLRAAVRGPVIYNRVPPLDKLMARLGETAKQPAVESLEHFIATKQHDGAAESTVPNLDALSLFLRDTLKTLPIELRFALVDLVRTAMSDPRFSGYYAEEPSHKTIAGLITHINALPECPYNLRLVTLQLGCNLFSSPLYTQHILSCPILTQPLVQLITTSLLYEKHHNVRVAAASLALNMAAANAKLRVDEHREELPEGDQVELAASLLEAIGVEEESEEALKGFLLALGQLVFCAPKEGELVDLLKSMDAQGTVMGKGKKFPKEALVGEIGKELLGKGL